MHFASHLRQQRLGEFTTGCDLHRSDALALAQPLVLHQLVTARAVIALGGEKPAIAGLDDHDLNEHLCLKAGRRAGLAAVRTQVGRFGDESAVVVERYDRRFAGEDIVRIHQEDLCQALSVPPAGKYQNEGGPGPRDVARLLRRVMPPAADDAAVWRLDALIWNWLMAGTDAHAKNYSILLAGDQVRLAPLYDISSALPYDTDEKKLRLAMKIGGDYSVFPAQNTWPGAAGDLGLPADELVDRVRVLATQAPVAFADAANEPAIKALRSALPRKLAGLVADRADRCLRVVT
jgi:serine/threonine-protein kinase HipA